MQKAIPLPYYLQQYEITKSQLTNFSQMPHVAESLQMTMNPYLKGGSSITGIEIIQTIDLATLHTFDIEIIPTIGIETIQTIEILDIKIIDHAIILTTDQNIIVIKIDHAKIHRTEVQAITIDKGITLNHYIGITHIIKIHHKIIGVVPLNIKDK